VGKLKTLDKINSELRKRIEKDRVKILTHFSKEFSDFFLQLQILDASWYEKEDEYIVDYEFAVSFGEAKVDFLKAGDEYIYNDGPDEADFIGQYPIKEFGYFEEIMEELQLKDHICPIVKEKNEEKAKEFTKEYSGKTILEVVYEDDLFHIKCDNGETLIARKLKKI